MHICGLPCSKRTSISHNPHIVLTVCLLLTTKVLNSSQHVKEEMLKTKMGWNWKKSSALSAPSNVHNSNYWNLQRNSFRLTRLFCEQMFRYVLISSTIHMCQVENSFQGEFRCEWKSHWTMKQGVRFRCFWTIQIIFIKQKCIKLRCSRIEQIIIKLCDAWKLICCWFSSAQIRCLYRDMPGGRGNGWEGAWVGGDTKG